MFFRGNSGANSDRLSGNPAHKGRAPRGLRGRVGDSVRPRSAACAPDWFADSEFGARIHLQRSLCFVGLRWKATGLMRGASIALCKAKTQTPTRPRAWPDSRGAAWMWRNADVPDVVGWPCDRNESLPPERTATGFYGPTSIGHTRGLWDTRSHRPSAPHALPNKDGRRQDRPPHQPFTASRKYGRSPR